MTPLKVAFAGTPTFAARALDAIIAAGYAVPLVLTQPDRPAGRGMKPALSEVKQRAQAHGLAIDQPERLRTAEQHARLLACRPDVLVVAAYGLILPPEVLTLPRLGCLNIHASCLPRWRGAAPIHRAIEAGDPETGITIMQMDAGLDTGPMLLIRTLPIAATDTTASLHDKLAQLGAEAIVDILARLQQGAPPPATPQSVDGVTYAHKIARHEARLDWRRSAIELERAVRAFNPFPVAFGQLRGTVIKLWSAQANPGEPNLAGTDTSNDEPGTVLACHAKGIDVACGAGVLRIGELQRPGSRRLPTGEFLRGFAIHPGERFELADA
ncbi:MAG: methionyl-tRNA formyltransferase [Azoarcus sp.]|jgi:methionyl-tRNA formyltransferase|nr:methionyl-tRNA formyltransferase [Azoarcus sp.]